MEAFSDYSHNLWHSDDLAGENGAGVDTSVGPEIHSAALSSLIEDKEIAARAVAIVIGSARRGVVSLCADVAELLKAKRSLERQVNRLMSENSALRNSSSTSSQPDVCNFEACSGSANTSGYHSRPAVACTVEVHADAKPGMARPSSIPSVLDLSANTTPSRPRRRHKSIQWPVTSIRGQMNCEQDELESLRNDVRAVLRANAAIVNELMSTKEELNRLRGCKLDGLSTESLCPLCRCSPQSLTLDPRPASVPAGAGRPTNRSVAMTVNGSVSLLGCACRQCFLLRRQGFPRRLLQLTTVNSNQVIRIKDVVSTIDGRRGCVKYMGHIDNDPEKDLNSIWLGIEFDEAVGSGDGKLDSKRYFSCRPQHGDFVRVQAIEEVIYRSGSPPMLSPSSEPEDIPTSAVYITDYI